MSKTRTYTGISEAQAAALASERERSRSVAESISSAHRLSASVAWDWSKRQPKNLREAVNMARRAYEDEVPTTLHDHQIGDGGTPQMAGQFVSYLDTPGATDAKGCDCGRNRPTTKNRPLFMVVEGSGQREHEAALLAYMELPDFHRTRLGHGVTLGGTRYIYVDRHTLTCSAMPANRPLVSHYLTPFRAALARLERGSSSEQRRARIVKHVTIGAQSPTDAAITEKAHPFDAKLVAEDALRSFLRTLSDLRVDVQPEVTERNPYRALLRTPIVSEPSTA